MSSKSRLGPGVVSLTAAAIAFVGWMGCGGGTPSDDLGGVDGGGDETGVDDSAGDSSGGFLTDSDFDSGSGCKPRTCADVGANCGPVADGCGGLTADCGSCSAGQVCGGGGVPSVCGTTINDGGGCIPLTCDKAGANCGPIGDGCGGVLDCGKCPAGQSCGGGGTPSVCGITYIPADGGMLGDGGTCIKKTCADYPGANCGPVADGCGGLVDCGSCTKTGEICGGGGVPNVCANPYSDGGGCKPKTCADYPGVNCGPVSDGCGGSVDCGTCTAPYICGGSGKASVCGNPYADDAGVVCHPKTCADYPGVNCGYVADGCGGAVSCGTCTSPFICGGGGKPNVCGDTFASDSGMACTPKKCTDVGATCGWIGDGCGGTVFCGNCTWPDICGGGGTPSVCGGGTTDGGTVSGCTDPLCSKIPVCMAGTETSISGTVYAPNGVEPLYNAVVYIPKTGSVTAFPDTVTCDRCDTPIPAIASAVTGPDGKFTLKGAIPSGSSIPLVIQLGRWRRYVTIPTVSSCVPNPLAATLTRLPRKQAEGSTYDNIPRMAIATGDVDALECVLRKMGIDDTVFGDPTFTAGSGKRIHFYVDNGTVYSGATPSWTSLADSPTTMSKYDAIIYACRGSEGAARTSTELKNLRDYTAVGGRLFATHFSYMWLYNNAEWAGAGTWLTGSNPATASDTTPLVSDVVTSFTKGANFAQWLNIVGALASVTPPKVNIYASRRNVSATVSPTVNWITSASPVSVQHLTWNTPYGGATTALCGRVLYSDFHVTNAATAGTTFPSECTTGAMTAQEKILEFMLFDLASCVNGDNLPPPPPPTCTKKTCADFPAGTCGQVADGCGGLTANCGTCTAPDTCGGGGTPGKCGGPKCTPKTCTDLGYNCGLAGDGCGGEINCGTCTAPDTCGGGGVAGICGGPKCTPQTCASVGATCGYIGDGCGSKLYCGDCTAPDTCGGGGVSGKCGSPKCTPRDCAYYGYSCGWVGDGCGGSTYCGDCTAPATCGGGGVSGKCGAPTTTPCTPKTCTDLGLKCGPAGDGCGGLIDCGSCSSPATCGGGGTPGVCGAPTCTPTTCAKLGFNCGPAADGCGGVLDCGTCTPPSTCGGGGTPNTCSGGPR